jgi:8-oxo-dGTP pyrophosphatase MutT (NUDIX family)
MLKEFQRFVISQVAILIRDNKCLILEDAAHPGKWILPGGRMDEGELSEPAFKREIKEEIGLESFTNLGIIDHDIWYPGRYQDNAGVCALAFLIENDNDEIKLSSEHLQARWINSAELDDYYFIWPNAKRMIKKGFDYFVKK